MKTLATVYVVAVALLLASCGGEPPVEQTTEALGTPHFVVGPDPEWSYQYTCPGNPTRWTMHLTPDVAVSSPLVATSVQLDSEAYRAPGMVSLAGFTEALTNDMDGPYHIAYNTRQTVACFVRENTVQGDCSNRVGIAPYGIWIYAAGERADYPRGLAVITMDPVYGGDGLYDSVGRCSMQKQIALPL
jgi:hypothetical protein